MRGAPDRPAGEAPAQFTPGPGLRCRRAPAGRRRGGAGARPGRGALRGRRRPGHPVRAGPSRPGAPQGGWPARRHGLHVPQPGALHDADRARCRCPGHRGRSPPLRAARRGAPSRRRHRRRRPAPGPGRSVRRVPTTTPPSALLCGRWPITCAGTAGVRSCSRTTTPSSTGKLRTALGWAGSARTPTCCCPGRARGSCSARSSRTRRWRSTFRPRPTAAARVDAASTAVPRARSSPTV